MVSVSHDDYFLPSRLWAEIVHEMAGFGKKKVFLRRAFVLQELMPTTLHFTIKAWPTEHHGGENTASENLLSRGPWEGEKGTYMWGKNHWKTELCFVDGINVKQGPLGRIILKRNEKYIKLCLIYGIYRLLTSRYKVLFPWSSLSLMYYLSVNVVHSEHNSYGNISVPTAALLHPWNSVIFKFPHC